MFARARDLVRTDAMVPALLADAIVPVGQVELAPVIRAIGVARRLSTALALEMRDCPAATVPLAATRRADHRALQSDAQWVDRLAARVHEYGTSPSMPRL